MARQNANNVAFFDVERIEVLRGPQGTLFGRNTTGGAVALYMRKPAETFGGFVEVGYGSYERAMARGSVDLPISERLLTKISAFAVDEEGFVDNLTTGETLNGQEAYGARLDLAWLILQQGEAGPQELARYAAVLMPAYKSQGGGGGDGGDAGGGE